MGVPFSRDLMNSRAAIIGVPFHCGTHPVRIGARLGPAAIREQSALVRRFEPPYADFDPVARLGLVDAETRPCVSGRPVRFHSAEGYRLITGEDLFARGFAPVLSELHQRLAERPVALCFRVLPG